MAERLHEGLVRDAEVLVATSGENGRPLVMGPGGQFGGQAGLPDSGLAGQERDPPLPRRRLLPQLAEPLELGLAADEDAPNVKWRHNLADITPGEAAAVSYLPKVDTTRMKEVWGFRCAWTTAESVVDLRRAVAGRVAVAKRRIDLPWRLRFPHTRVGTMLAVDSRLVAAGYGREAQRLAADAGTALAWADRPAALPDERLEAALAVLHDELAWAWSVVAVGAALDGRLGDPFDGLAVRLPDGAPIAAANPLAGAPPQGRHAASRALAERTAAALAGALVALVGERARRLVTAGRLDAAGDVAHLA